MAMKLLMDLMYGVGLNVADTLQSALFVAATAFLFFLVLLEFSAVPELPLIVQCKLCACQPAAEMMKLLSLIHI